MLCTLHINRIFDFYLPFLLSLVALLLFFNIFIIPFFVWFAYFLLYFSCVSSTVCLFAIQFFLWILFFPQHAHRVCTLYVLHCIHPIPRQKNQAFIQHRENEKNIKENAATWISFIMAHDNRTKIYESNMMMWFTVDIGC